MLMDLAQWRQLGAAQRFVELMNRYHVRSVCSDQDYINAMFQGRIIVLDPRWDVMVAGELTPPKERWLIHYNLIGKPWLVLPQGRHGRRVLEVRAGTRRSCPRIEQVRDEFADKNMVERDHEKKRRLIAHAGQFSELPVTFHSLEQKGVPVRL